MKLFKRRDHRDAPYYCRFQCRVREYVWSTKTNDLSLAGKRAKEYRNAVVAKQYHVSGAMMSRSGAATFGQLMEDYKTHPSPGPATKKLNLHRLKAVLLASRMGPESTIDRLGAEMAIAWQKAGVAAGKPPTTINAGLRAARSLFSKRSVILYAMAHKPDPGLVRDFFSVPMLRENEMRLELPTVAADQLAHEKLPAEPALYRAFLLARYGGLRAGEVIAARKDWIEGNVIYVGGREFAAKSRRWRPVALPVAIITSLLAGPGESIVGDDAAYQVERVLPVRLRELGLPKKKPLHSLRRLAGSIVATTQSIRAAKDLLGHSSVAVTEKHYARSLDAPAAISASPHFIACQPDPVDAQLWHKIAQMQQCSCESVGVAQQSAHTR